MSFKRVLADLVVKFGGTKRDLAFAAGITPSTLSHLLKGAPIGTEVCLRLARATGTPPSDLLRAAGKGDVADLLEQMYGPASAVIVQTVVTPHERRHLDALRRLDARSSRAVDLIIRGIVGEETSTDGRIRRALRA